MIWDLYYEILLPDHFYANLNFYKRDQSTNQTEI